MLDSLIRSRNKHLDHEHALQEELTALKHSVRSARVLPDLEWRWSTRVDGAEARVDGEHHRRPPPYSLAPAKARRRWREDFYDHFLDGAAGVMYTSVPRTDLGRPDRSWDGQVQKMLMCA